VIDHARDFYAQLGRYYDALKEVADRERVKMLLDYLSACEKRHAQALAEYELTAPHEIIDTWFKWGADKATNECLEPAKLSPDMDVDTVLREALRLDQCLSDLYQEIVERAHTERIREIFTDLLEANKKDMRNLVRGAVQMRDW
jgi:rubrerythrin